jgi:hypothetical protein
VRSANTDEEEKPKKLPVSERSDRFEQLRVKLSGLTLRGELEPSYMLVDKFVHMEETGELRYLRWEEFTRRDQEMRGVKKDGFWKQDEAGHFKRVYKETEQRVELKDHLAMKYALQRRGLAFEVSKLMSFKVHERIVDVFFETLAREPIPGFSPVSIEQVRRADKEIFMRLSELTRAGFTMPGDPDKLPLDDNVDTVLAEPRIQALVFELPSGPGGGKRNTPNEDRPREEFKRLKANSPGKGPGKGKDQTKAKTRIKEGQ